MVSEQVVANEAVAKAMAEATRATFQVMAAIVVERPQSIALPKLGRPAIKTAKLQLGGRQQVQLTQNIQVRSQ